MDTESMERGEALEKRGVRGGIHKILDRFPNLTSTQKGQWSQLAVTGGVLVGIGLGIKWLFSKEKDKDGKPT
jgi:hypothetical protein